MRIGIFDSGIGGKAVANTLRNSFPAAEVLTVSDVAHLPYGSRPAAEIVTLTDAAIQPLLAASCDVIVIACNSATAAAIETLRERYPDERFIGLEPMLKPATAMTKTGVIAVCATPVTLASPRYQKAKQDFAVDKTVFEPDCSTWAHLIESNQMNRSLVDEVVTQCLDAGADVIVLACTHFHWIEEEITTAANGRAVVIEPSDAIALRVRELLNL